jgi:hypothetical protein
MSGLSEGVEVSFPAEKFGLATDRPLLPCGYQDITKEEQEISAGRTMMHVKHGVPM